MPQTLHTPSGPLDLGDPLDLLGAFASLRRACPVPDAYPDLLNVLILCASNEPLEDVEPVIEQAKAFSRNRRGELPEEAKTLLDKLASLGQEEELRTRVKALPPSSDFGEGLGMGPPGRTSQPPALQAKRPAPPKPPVLAKPPRRGGTDRPGQAPPYATEYKPPASRTGLPPIPLGMGVGRTDVPNPEVHGGWTDEGRGPSASPSVGPDDVLGLSSNLVMEGSPLPDDVISLPGSPSPSGRVPDFNLGSPEPPPASGGLHFDSLAIGASKPGGPGTASDFDPAPTSSYRLPAPRPHGTPRSPQETEAAAARVKALGTSKKVSEKRLGGGTNSSHLFIFEDGSKGVFKPAAGEAEWLRQGVPGGTCWRREVAAYRLAELLGFDDLVPPTTTRTEEDEGKSHPGSVQQFVEGWVASDHLSFRRYGSPEDAVRAAVFDFLICNSDRHSDNWLVTSEGRPILIDNGLGFPVRYISSDLANTNFWNHAVGEKFSLPDLSVLRDKWPEAEAVLREEGIEDEAIELTRRRFEALLGGGGQDFKTFMKTALPEWAFFYS